MSNLPIPLVPSDCDLRGYRMMLDGPRLLASEFHANSSDSEWRAGVVLWLKSLEQMPGGSLPDDDSRLAVLAEIDLRKWRKVKSGALRGWQKCVSDGRLYHRVVAEFALEAHISRQKSSKSAASGVKKRNKIAFDPKAFDDAILRAMWMLYALNPVSKCLLKSDFFQQNKGKIPTGGQTTGETGGSTDSVTGGSTTSEPEIPPPVEPSPNYVTSTSTLSVVPRGTTGASAADPWKEVYAYGRDLLGSGAGGIITNLRKTFDDKPRKVMAKLQDAAEQREPVPWINAFLWKHGPEGIEVQGGISV